MKKDKTNEVFEEGLRQIRDINILSEDKELLLGKIIKEIIKIKPSVYPLSRKVKSIINVPIKSILPSNHFMNVETVENKESVTDEKVEN